MESVLKFNLANQFDKELYLLHSQAEDLYHCVRQFDQWLRTEAKFKGNEEAQKYRDKLWEFLDGVSLDILS